jgi:hypothetical protein
MPLGSAVTKTNQQPAEVWTLLAQEVKKVAFGKGKNTGKTMENPWENPSLGCDFWGMIYRIFFLGCDFWGVIHQFS